MFFKSKKGVIVIYLTVIFASIMILITTLITLSISNGIDGSTRSLGHIWGKSITGEYDLNLLNDYGILAFYGNEKDVNKKINRYAKATFDEKKYIRYQGTQCDLSEYNLGDINVFQEAIKTASKWPKIKGNEPEERVNRKIASQRIIQSLPSRQLKGQQLKKGSKALTTAYIINRFNCHTDGTRQGNSYFKNELEYLICGKTSDESNFNEIKRKFLLTRLGANSAYIYSSKEMQAITMGLAETITPGPGAIVTQTILNETWALLESENDWKLVTNGEKVPLVKSRDSWALDESVLEDEDFDGYVNPNNNEGMTYDEYIKLMILTMDEETLLLHTMDLIQINMKYNYYSDFLINQYNTGLKFNMKVNGDAYEFKDEY